MKSAALLAVALIAAAVGPALAQPMAAQIEYSPEEYLAQGKTTGCGISFLTVWAGDGGEAIGVSGSINFYVVLEHKNVMAIIKASALLNHKVTPVTYAWLETPGYGRSNDFTKVPSEEPGVFIGSKNSDANTLALVLELARSGGTFGIQMKDRPLDDVVKFPASPEDVQRKVIICVGSLNDLAMKELR